MFRTRSCHPRPNHAFRVPRQHLHITRSPVISNKVLIEVVKEGLPSFVQPNDTYISLAEQKQVKRIYPAVEKNIPTELHGKLTRSLYNSVRITRNEQDFAEIVPDQFLGRIIRITAAEPVSMRESNRVISFLSPEAHLTSSLAYIDVHRTSIALIEGTTIYMMYRETGLNKNQNICDPQTGQLYIGQHYVKPAYFRSSSSVHTWMFGTFKQPPFLKHFILSDPERSLEDELLNVLKLKSEFTEYNRSSANCSYPVVKTILGVEGPFGLIPQRTMAGIFLHKCGKDQEKLIRKILSDFSITKTITESNGDLFPSLSECGSFIAND